MKIGLTYDLRDYYLQQGCSLEETAEFDSLETIIAIEKALQAQGFTTERIGNLQQLVLAVAAGQRWDLVFNIAEGRFGNAREAQVPAILDAYQIPYVFSDPKTLAICLDKAIAKCLVRAKGIATASFWVLKNQHDLSAQRMEFKFPLFVKPVAEGSSKGVGEYSKVMNLTELAMACELLWNNFHQPVLVEEYLPGREFTVGIIGNGEQASVLGVMEILLQQNAEASGYSFLNKQQWQQRIKLQLATDQAAQQAAAVALAAWRELDCCDAGRVDIRLDADGRACFLEVNPLAGLNPTNSDLILLGNLLDISYNTIIQRIMQASMARLKIISSPKLEAV